LEIAKVATPTEAWQRRWKKWMQQLRRQQRKHPRLMAFLRFISLVILILLVEVVLAVGLLLAGLSGLLDFRTITSVAVTEVGITIILYYLLGHHRRERLDEIVNLMDAATRFKHLRVYTYQILPVHYYYVENTLTKQAYQAPSYIENIVDDGVFEVIRCKNYREMKRKLRENQTMLNEFVPSLTDLLKRNNVEHKA
jgi:hypothetical protein